MINGFAKGLSNLVFGAISADIADDYAEKQANRNFELQKKENEQVFQHNKELAAYQNSLNLAQWNRENAYNSPSAQMARYAAAGLNPDLIYGQQNSAASSPQLIGGTSKQSANVAESRNAAIQSIASLQNIFAQNSLLRAQVDNIKADTDNKKADTHGKEIENAFNKTTFEERVLGINLSNQTSAQVVDNLIKEGKLLDTNREKAIQEIENLKRNLDVLDQNIHESQSRIQNLDQDTRNKIIESDLLKKKIDETASIIYKNNAETQYYKEKSITEKDVRDNLRALTTQYISTANLNNQAFENNKVLFPLQHGLIKAQTDDYTASKSLKEKMGENQSAQAGYYKKLESVTDRNTIWQNVNGSVGALGSLLNAVGEIIPM